MGWNYNQETIMEMMMINNPHKRDDYYYIICSIKSNFFNVLKTRLPTEKFLDVVILH